MPDMTSAQAAALWSGLLILLLVILSVRVALARRDNRVLLGDGGNAGVTLAGRVFGNAQEYIPAGLAALALLVLLGMPAWPIHVVGATLFVGRLTHALTLSDRRVTLGRMVSMTLTWLALIAAGAMLVVHAFVGGPHG
jgi:uncharacterized membrane protein YecN with MAPEG domain